MGEPVKLLSPHEAALLAGVSERDMHRAIDEEIVPDYLMQVSGGCRRFTPAACALMAYYVALAEKLTGKERRRVINEMAPRVHGEFSEGRHLSRHLSISFFIDPDSKREADLRKEFEPFIKKVREGLARVEEARGIVTCTPDILSGTPVIRGTRIPVYSVAGTYAEEGLAGARDAYPHLDAETIELAKLYADTHPPRGRPSTRAVPKGARVVKTLRRARRDGGPRSGRRT